MVPPRKDLALAAAIVLASAWTIRYERGFPRDEHNLEAFAHQLQETYPTLPPGTQLYVVGATIDITLLTTLTPYIIGTYYPGVQATFILPAEATRLQPSLFARPAHLLFSEHATITPRASRLLAPIAGRHSPEDACILLERPGANEGLA